MLQRFVVKKISPNLVALKQQTSKIQTDMTKVQKISKNITPFTGVTTHVPSTFFNKKRLWFCMFLNNSVLYF